MKKGLIVLLTVMTAIAVVASVSYADQNCQNMKAVSIISNEGISSGGQVIFKNMGASATCGNQVAPGATVVFPLPANNPDKTMALVLTGMSLTRTFVLWVEDDLSGLKSVSLEDQ